MKPACVSLLVVGCFLGATPHDASSQVPAGQDTVYVAGDTFHSRSHAGLLESTINGDTNASGARINPNRVYALYRGQIYFQRAPINVYNPTGKVTICGVPSDSGAQKPIILIEPVAPSTSVSTMMGATVNVVFGSLKCDGIHYQAMQLNGTLTNELFMCGTANHLPQSLEVNNCLFEFSSIDLFDCTNESGAIGGWPYGAKFRITNSYFRNMFHPGQWWGSRVFQCKHPIDTMWVENNTLTTSGMAFLQQNQLTDFAYFNHNTFVNSKKYLLTGRFFRRFFMLNNIFINQNWVGEDTNIVMSGSDPERSYTSTINIDSISVMEGVVVQPRFLAADSIHFLPALNLNHLIVIVSDNIYYYDPLLINGYYNSSKYKHASLNALPSYLGWLGYPGAPFPIENVPGEWMNTRTRALFAAYAPPNGGFLEKRTSMNDPGTVTPGIADASVVDSMAVWNQNQWGDPRFPMYPTLINSKYIFGDYDPTTLPGIVNGIKTDKDTLTRPGIVRFTDLTENFSQNGVLSAIDNLPIGSVIWDDAKFAAYNSSVEYALVAAKFADIGVSVPARGGEEPASFALFQNYPNPFNPTTTIQIYVGGVVAPSGAIPSEVEGPASVIRGQWSVTSVVRLAIYDILGREVAVLANARYPAGTFSFTFDGTHLASGVYFCRLTAGSFTAVRKMSLIR